MTRDQEQVLVIIEIHAKAGEEQEARDRLLGAISTSRKPGMVSSQEYEDPNDPGAFYATQIWENAGAFEAHMNDAAASGMSQEIQVLREEPKTTVLKAIVRHQSAQ